MLPLQPTSHVQSRPAHCRVPVHAEALPEGQQAVPAAPHAHAPAVHVTPLLHIVPLQHSCPGSPQAQSPVAVTHVRLVLHVVPQHASPTAPPHTTQPASVHSCPTPQFMLLHAAALPLEPPLPEPELLPAPPLELAAPLLDPLEPPPVVASSVGSVTVPVAPMGGASVMT
jgi:hypothetical protein